MISNKENIVKRGVKAQPLTYDEMDTNLNELMNVIDDVHANAIAQDAVNADVADDIVGLGQAMTTGLNSKINIADIINVLNSNVTDKPLSAAQGKVLYDMLLANNATIINYKYTLTAGQTTISGTDLNGNTLAYVPGVPMLVVKDGGLITIVDDYAATTGTSIVLTSAVEQTAQFSITTFGSFTVADHYTKGESDGRYFTQTQSDARYYQQSQTYTQAQVNDLLSSSVGQGFIEGLQLVWVSGTNIQIRAGSAYVPSVGKRVSYAGGNITPTGVVDINTHVHIYLNAAGTIFQSLTAPARYYNNAWVLTGNNANRYIGSILINTNALGAYKFRHDVTNNKMWYIHGAPETVPFRIMNGTTGPLVGQMQTNTVLPITAHTFIGAFRNNGTGSINWTPSDAGTSIATGWTVFNTANSMFSAEMPLSSIDNSITYSITSGAAGYCYTTGYIFDR